MSKNPKRYIDFRLWNLDNSKINSKLNNLIFQKIEDEFEVTLNKEELGKYRKSKKIKDRLYLHFDTLFSWPDIKDQKRTCIGFCPGLSNHIAILVDGTVIPCCLDANANINLGNINNNTLNEILQSQKVKIMKKGFDNNELKEELCKRCTFIERFENKHVRHNFKKFI